MIVGCCKEIKNSESRVGLTPSAVAQLTKQGSSVLIEHGAGFGSGFSDDDFVQAGARVVAKSTVFTEAEMIVKVKEPLPEEIPFFRSGQILFTFLHLAACKDLTEGLLRQKVVGISYETVEKADGTLPILAPMSIIAGRLAPQVGAASLQSNHGGMGILLCGVPGVGSAEVVVLGAGNVGLNAARVASGMGARVTVMGMSEEAQRLDYISSIGGMRIDTAVLSEENVRQFIQRADLLVCGILIKGFKTPKLITREMLRLMKPGSVIVDVSVDQGGCCETTHPTTHAQPTYIVDKVIHYCVTNMPGIVARTSTMALVNATIPFVCRLAKQGLAAISSDKAIAKGVNTFKGDLTNSAVAESLNLPYKPLEEAITSGSAMMAG